MSNTGHKNIMRYDNPKKNMHGYRVVVQWKGVILRKFFSDANYGDVALDEAITWRNMVEDDLNKPRTERHIQSSRKGISLVKDGRGKESYVAQWNPEAGRAERVYFSVSKYGREEAKRLATELRHQKEREIISNPLTRGKDFTSV